jgi:hypothetical protein
MTVHSIKTKWLPRLTTLSPIAAAAAVRCLLLPAVDRTDAAAITPAQAAPRLPTLPTRPAAPSGTPAAGGNNFLSALLGPLTDGAGGRGQDLAADDEDYDTAPAPSIGGMIDNIASALDEKLVSSDGGPLLGRSGTSMDLEATNQRVEQQLRSGNHAGALKTVMDEIVGDLMG